MNEAELRGRVDGFPTWRYGFDLSGVRTPIFDRRHVNRHETARFLGAPLRAVRGLRRRARS